MPLPPDVFTGGIVCLALLPTLGAELPAAFTGDEPKHLQAARRLVRDVKPRNNSYEHKVDVVKWQVKAKDRPAECHTDCSGLLNALLRHSYGVTKQDRKAWIGKERPQAKDYYQAIRAENGFRRVGRVQDLRPGDILTIQYPAGLPDTGHLLIVAETPRRREATAPTVAKTEQWEVKVIDCSHTGHGTKDTRRKADGGFYSGVGRGTFRLYARRSGTLAGYAWSNWSGSTFYGPDERRLTAGRLRLPVKKAD
jgi:hypothetical protein